MPMTPPQQPPCDDLALRLHQLISTGACLQGDRLMPERDLADKIGVSRARLRPALARLERDGVIFRRQGQGTFVTPPPAAESNQFRFLCNRVTAAEVMEARLLLEPALVRRAACQAGAGDMALLRRLALATQSAETSTAYEQADKVFHFKIAEIAGNLVMQALFEAIGTVRHQPAWSEHRQRHWSREKAQLLAAQHLAICDMMTPDTAAKAAELMRRHLQKSAKLFEVPSTMPPVDFK